MNPVVRISATTWMTHHYGESWMPTATPRFAHSNAPMWRQQRQTHADQRETSQSSVTLPPRSGTAAKAPAEASDAKRG